jgi:hypothetical protein
MNSAWIGNSSASCALTVLLLPFVLAGCDLFGKETRIDEDIQAFVEAESLPEAQRPEIGFADAEADVTAFRVDFGPGCDCPSGCFYSTAFGLQFRDRIGWMEVTQAFCLRDSLRIEQNRFDLRPRDSVLFSTTFRERFRREATVDDANDVQAPVYEVFLDMLATDEDTPRETLLELARLLQDVYRPGLGYALLENPVVRSSTPILEVLAGLPDEGGYRGVRDRARGLLDQLSEGGGGVGAAFPSRSRKTGKGGQ